MVLLLYVFLPLAHDDLIDVLIEQLGSERIEHRERAAVRLRSVGKKAVPALRRALKSSDAEVRGRARDVLAALGIRIVALRAVDPADITVVLHDLFQGCDRVKDVAFDPATRTVIFRGSADSIETAREVVTLFDLDTLQTAGARKDHCEAEIVFQILEAAGVDQ